MTEADIIDHLYSIVELSIVGLGAMTTVVFAYVAGLYYFIRKSPGPIKVITFAFFSAIYLLLTSLGMGLIQGYEWELQALAELAEKQELSVLSRNTLAGQQGIVDLLNVAIFGILCAGVLLTLGYMTFFHSWQHEEPE